MRRSEKEEAVRNLAQKLERAQSVVLSDYRGLTVREITELRRRLREAGVEFRVLKNTLTRRAADAVGIKDIDRLLAGPTALAFAYEDPVVAAKLISEFMRDHKALQIKGGVLRDRVIGDDAVKELASLPAREVLLARVLGGMQAPMAGLVGVLSGTLRKLVYALDALRRAREEAASAVAAAAAGGAAPDVGVAGATVAVTQ